jgi:hypothetical protein
MADSAAAITMIYTAKTWPIMSSNIKELINIINVIDNNIISIEINISIIFFLLNTKDNILIKNKLKAINI